MNRRRFHRSLFRVSLSFSLFCSVLFVLYGNIRVINDPSNTESNSDSQRQSWSPREATQDERKSRFSGLTSKKAYKLFAGDKRRALQGFFELKNGSPEFRTSTGHEPRQLGQLGRYFGCTDIRHAKIVADLGHGYTKSVQKGLISGTEVAVKSVLESNKDVQHCLNSHMNYTTGECYNLIKYKLAKEIILLQQLKHTNIVTLLGFCWQNEVNSRDIRERGLTMVTELGQPMDVLLILQLPWQERFRICLGLARLIHYLSVSPLGSLIIRDFKHNQFILVSGEIKLTDMDDVDNEERACSSSAQCIVGSRSANWSLSCVSGRCVGFNAAFNMMNICRFFLEHILVTEAPQKLREHLQNTLARAQTLQMNSEKLVENLETALKRLQNGAHITFDPIHIHDYSIIPEADFPALHDYNCGDSRSMTSCELAVFSFEGAKYECSRDKRCMAFVVTRFKTWVGYTIIFLKSNITGIRYNKDTSVFFKVKR